MKDQDQSGSKCLLSFNITEKINAPIFLYYQLDDFFLNYRLLVNSKIWKQLRGEEIVRN